MINSFTLLSIIKIKIKIEIEAGLCWQKSYDSNRGRGRTFDDEVVRLIVIDSYNRSISFFSLSLFSSFLRYLHFSVISWKPFLTLLTLL